MAVQTRSAEPWGMPVGASLADDTLNDWLSLEDLFEEADWTTSGSPPIQQKIQSFQSDHQSAPDRDFDSETRNENGKLDVGRLDRADLSFFTHPLRLESVEESDCSWTEADGEQEWHLQLRLALKRFRESDELTILTPSLRSRQRKEIHSTANIWGLSHLSLGSGKAKKVLVSKCRLSQPYNEDGSDVEKRWNPSTGSWHQGTIDPTSVCFYGAMSVSGLEDILADLHLSRNYRLWDSQPGMTNVTFGTAADATIAMAALSGKRIWTMAWDSEAGYETVVQCSYIIRPEGPNFSTDSHHLGPPLHAQLIADYPLTSAKAEPLFISTYDPFLSDEWGGNDLDETDPDTDATDASLSTLDSDYSAVSSVSKKRRRQDMVINGFPCTWPSCGRVFDHEGERRKHGKTPQRREASQMR